MNCVHCGKDVDMVEVSAHFVELFAQADALGMDSLGEDDQAIVEGHYCVRCLEVFDCLAEPDDGSCSACGCCDCDCGGPTPAAIPCLCCGELFLVRELSSVGVCKHCKNAGVEEEILASEEAYATPKDLAAGMESYPMPWDDEVGRPFERPDKSNVAGHSDHWWKEG